MENKTT